MTIRISVVLTVLAAALATAPARAADLLQLTTEVFQEVESADAAGKKQKRMVAATRVVPGSEVIYVITYRHVGDRPADKVVVTNPVPRELALKPGSASGAGAAAEVSVDGGKRYGQLEKLSVTGADGKPRAAQGGDVTHVRWLLGAALKPGDTGKVTYRATLR